MGILSASYPSLRGKRVVVTGGGSGIGAAIVDAFARQAARVTFLDIADAESKVIIDLTEAAERQMNRVRQGLGQSIAASAWGSRRSPT